MQSLIHAARYPQLESQNMSLFKGLTSAFAPLSIAVFMALTASPAHADCEDPKNAFDDVYCYSKLYIEADGELNKAYGELAEKLTKAEKATLKKSELAWIRARNGKCSRQEGDDNFVDMDCAVAETRARTSFLQERTAECNAGQCDGAKLAD